MDGSLPSSSAMSGTILILAAALLWSTIGVTARIPLSEGLEPLTISFWRALVASLCYGAHAAWIGRVSVERRDLPGLMGFALLGVTIFFGAYFVAVREGGAALAAILLYTAPAWVAMGSVLWLREHLTRPAIAALVLTFGGVVLVALGGTGSGGSRITPLALGAGLLSGIAYASYYLLGKRYFARYPAPTVYTWILPAGALAMLPAVEFAVPSTKAMLAIVYLAVVPTYLAYLIYSYGLMRIPATRAATLATVEPVLAGALAWLVWGERFGLLGYLGAGVVMLGVLVSGRGGTDQSDGVRSRATHAAG